MTGKPQNSASFDPRSWIERPDDAPPPAPPRSSSAGSTVRTVLALAIGMAILLAGAALAWNGRTVAPPASAID